MGIGLVQSWEGLKGYNYKTVYKAWESSDGAYQGSQQTAMTFNWSGNYEIPLDGRTLGDGGERTGDSRRESLAPLGCHLSTHQSLLTI